MVHMSKALHFYFNPAILRIDVAVGVYHLYVIINMGNSLLTRSPMFSDTIVTVKDYRIFMLDVDESGDNLGNTYNFPFLPGLLIVDIFTDCHIPLQGLYLSVYNHASYDIYGYSDGLEIKKVCTLSLESTKLKAVFTTSGMKHLNISGIAYDF